MRFARSFAGSAVRLRRLLDRVDEVFQPADEGLNLHELAIPQDVQLDLQIEPAIIEASRFFDPLSGAPLDDPRVRVVLDGTSKPRGTTGGA